MKERLQDPNFPRWDSFGQAEGLALFLEVEQVGVRGLLPSYLSWIRVYHVYY